MSKSNNVYKMLCEAIKKKDKKQARNLLQNIASVNVPSAGGNSPLHWAIVKFDDLDIMSILLDKGANIHAKNHRRQKPLQIAIQNNKTKAALLLINKGALFGENLQTWFSFAIEQNNATVVKSLIYNTVQINPLLDLKIPLKAAIFRGQAKIIEIILPYCKFAQSSDRYIPKEAVIGSSSEYKECVELLLKWNFTIHPTSHEDNNFVYRAVENGYLPIVLQLLKFGIDVNMVNPSTGLNLLKVACFNGHYDVVENLLKNNAFVNETTSTNTEILNHGQWSSEYIYESHSVNSLIYCKINLSNITCLHIAVLNSDLRITQLLLRYGATIVNDPELFYLTGIAVYNNCEEIIRTLLDYGVNVNGVDFEGKTLLYYCVNTGTDGQDYRYNVAKLLLEKGADQLIQISGNSLLFEAIQNGHLKTAQLFMDYNADIQCINSNGDTLLHKAIENHFHVEFIKTLLNYNLPVNAVNNRMLSPLHVACQTKSENQLHIIETLLNYNADTNCTDEDMKTPLHLACQNQNLEAVVALLGIGVNLNVIDNKGQTPVHLVCKYKSDFTLRLMQLLFHYNANIEAVDVRGWTPLFVACETNNDIAVKFLLENHADANRTDLENFSPLYVAAKNCKSNPETIKILLEHKVKVNVHCMDNKGNSVIHLIAATKFAELIRYFARTPINFNSVNNDGNTPLHIAVQNKSIKMTESLIRYGANVNILDKGKRTPLRNAIEYISNYQYSLKNIHNENDGSVSDYRNQIYHFTKIINILRGQVIKLKIAGLKVNYQNLNLINNLDSNQTNNNESLNGDDYKSVINETLKLEVNCEQEIEKMKRTNIGVNSMTFYDLLTKDIHLLSRFVKNKKIRRTLELEVYDIKFPLYINIIRSRFRDAKFRYRMMNSAKKYFTLNFTPQLSNDCIDIIFSHLNIADLKMFIRAIRRSNQYSVQFGSQIEEIIVLLY